MQFHKLSLQTLNRLIGREVCAALGEFVGRHGSNPRLTDGPRETRFAGADLHEQQRARGVDGGIVG